MSHSAGFYINLTASATESDINNETIGCEYLRLQNWVLRDMLGVANFSLKGKSCT